MIKLIIFDFDGTIADTLDSFLEIMDNLSEEFNFKKIKRQEVNKLKDKKPREILKNLGISMFKLPSLVKRVRLELNKEIKNVKPTVSIKPSLLKLKRKYKLVILTSNSEENVKTFLKNNSLNLFDKIYSGSSVFGKNKLIKNILRNNKLNKDEVIYIGDEVRDIEACKKLGVKIIAVAWGYNSKRILKKNKPNFLIENPEEILKTLSL